MEGSGRHKRRIWKLSPWAWILLVAAAGLAILSVVTSSSAAIGGLILVIAVWAALLASSFPSSQSAWRYPGDSGRQDFGAEAAERYEREHGSRD
jgi:hypothetical protein